MHWEPNQSIIVMKVYELILTRDGNELFLGVSYKDEKKAFAEKAVQNQRCGAKDDEYAPYQVREVKVL